MRSSAISDRTAPARRRPRGCWPACSSRRPAASSTAAATSATISIAFRHELGYVPEEPYLYPFLSGREYLELIGRLREIPEGAADDEDRRLPRPVRPERRRRSGDRVVLERHAAEDRDLRRAAARPVGGALRRARDRPRRHDDAGAAPSGPHCWRRAARRSSTARTSSRSSSGSATG